MSTFATPKAVRGGQERGDRNFRVLIILPAVSLIGLLMAYPMGYAVYLSLVRWNDKISPDHPFVGLDNYKQLIEDDEFRSALMTTLYISGPTVVLGVGLALGFALLLNRPFWGRTAGRVILLVPWAIPPVVAGIIWKLIFAGSGGAANFIARGLGLTDHNIQFLASSTSAIVILILVEVWKWTPFLALLFIAALQNVPGNLYKAALIDGAGPWKTFWRVTLPNIRGTVMFEVIIQSLFSIKVFDTIYILSGGSGGPAGSTTTINFLAYLVSFSRLERGYGAAMAISILILVLLVAGLWILLFSIPGRRPGAKAMRSARIGSHSHSGRDLA